jgi:hypothetical protein
MGWKDYIPKLSFEDMDFTSQIRIAMLLPMIPLLVSETLFFYLIIFAEWKINDAFSVSVTFCCLGIVAYFMFRDKARRSITNLEPVTAIHSWSKSISYFENLLVKEKIPLQEQEIVRPVEYKGERPLFENHPEIEDIVLERNNGKLIRKKVRIPIRVKPVKMGFHEIILRNPDLLENLIKSGKYYTEVPYIRSSIAPNNIPYKRAQYIHFFPQQDDFYPVPDQLIVHNAQVLTGSGAVIYAHFLYWGERLEPIPVFLVGASPQWTEIFQQSIGIKPVLEGSYEDGEDANNSYKDRVEDIGAELRMDIKSALKLGDTMEAMTYAMLLEGSQRKLEGMLDHNYTVEDQAIGLFGSWNRNRDIIRENRKWDWVKSRKLWLVILGIIAVSVFAWWWFF